MNFIAVYNKLRFFAEYNNFHEIKYLTIIAHRDYFDSEFCKIEIQ